MASILFAGSAHAGWSNKRLAFKYAVLPTESQFSRDDTIWVDDLTACDAIADPHAATEPVAGQEDNAIATNKAVRFPAKQYFLVQSKHFDASGREDYWLVSTDGVPGFSKKLYKMCLDIPENDYHRYVRTGGFDTGILVVPFKLRGHDLAGDATVGPYVGFRTQYVRVPFSLGLSQLSIGGTTVTATDTASGVTTVTTSGIETTTGVTVATGLVFSITPTFDIGALVGWDWALGADRKRFNHQGDAWISFGIGVNFTNTIAGNR